MRDAGPWPVAAVAMAIAAFACGDTKPPRPSLSAAAMAATLPAAVAPVAEPATSGEGAEVLELDEVDGRPEAPPLLASRVKEIPGPSSRLAGCLEQDGCTRLGAEEVWVETRDGFVTRWAVAELRGGDRKETDLAALLTRLAPSMKPWVGPGPSIELAPRGKLEAREIPGVWLLGARVHVPSASAARLMLSVNGAARVVLNGQLVHEEVGDQYLLPDHRTLGLTLAAGWNTLAVRLEKVSPYAVELAARLRGSDLRPLPGSVWALPAGVPDQGADACGVLAIELGAHVRAEGWGIEAKVDTHGLLPWPRPKTLALTLGGEVLVERALDGDLKTRELSVELGERTGSLALTLDGAVCARRELRAVAAKARYLEARGRLEALPEAAFGPGDRESLEYQALDARRLIEEAALDEGARRLEGTLAHFEAHVAGLSRGERVFEAPGVHVRAYRSRYDGSLQRYVVVVPRGYARSEAAPLIMLAHGLHYTPEDMLRIALARPSGPGEAQRSGSIYTWDPPEPSGGAILVAHDGYVNAGQRAPGEVDVRRVIDEMKAAYRIDARRVSISGFSLGGSVAFWVPLHAPSVFAAAAPLCGYPNLHEYRSVKSAPKRPWEPRLLDEEGVVAYAESGRYLPLKMVHGARDQPSRSELIHDRYKTLRYTSELEVPPLGHNVWDHAYEDGKLLKWLAARKRPAVAPQPVVRAGRYRWAESYWLRIERFADRERFGQLDGSLKGERVQVQTRNVEAFSILGHELGERAQRKQTIVVDGRNLGEHVIGEALHLAREEGASWAIAPNLDRWRSGKRADLEGPLGDVWYGPLIVVYGTQLGHEIEANRLAAERLALHSPWIDLRAPVFADVEVSDADLEGRSLVLVGRPATNLLTARVAPELAAAGIVFTDDGALEVAGRRFEGPEIGISVIRPSALVPGRYLVLHAGLGPDGTLSSRYLPELAPDYLVYDSGMRAVFGDRILGNREVLMGGFFDDDWRFSP